MWFVWQVQLLLHVEHRPQIGFVSDVMCICGRVVHCQYAYCYLSGAEANVL